MEETGDPIRRVLMGFLARKAEMEFEHVDILENGDTAVTRGARKMTSAVRMGLQTFAEQYAAAWCSKEPARVAGHFAEGGWLQVNGGEKAEGRAAIAGVAQSFMEAFPDLEVRLDGLAENVDRVEFHWTLMGTNDGPGGTGRRVRVSGFESWVIDAAGLIAESEGQFDEADYRRQLGA